MDALTRFTLAYLPSLTIWVLGSWFANAHSANPPMIGDKLWQNVGVFLGLGLSLFHCLVLTWSTGSFRWLSTAGCLACAFWWLIEIPRHPHKGPFFFLLSLLVVAIPWGLTRYRPPADQRLRELGFTPQGTE